MKRRRKNQLNDIEEKAFKKIGLNSKKSSLHFKKIKPTGNDPDHWDPTSYMTVGAASTHNSAETFHEWSDPLKYDNSYWASDVNFQCLWNDYQ